MESELEIGKWERYFALYENGELVCVTVYKRGAKEVKKQIEELKAQIAEQTKNPQLQGRKEANHVE